MREQRAVTVGDRRRRGKVLELDEHTEAMLRDRFRYAEHSVEKLAADFGFTVDQVRAVVEEDAPPPSPAHPVRPVQAERLNFGRAAPRAFTPAPDHRHLLSRGSAPRPLEPPPRALRRRRPDVARVTYTDDERKAALRPVILEEMTLAEASEAFGPGAATLARWLESELADELRAELEEEGEDETDAADGEGELQPPGDPLAARGGRVDSMEGAFAALAPVFVKIDTVQEFADDIDEDELTDRAILHYLEYIIERRARLDDAEHRQLRAKMLKHVATLGAILRERGAA